MQIGYARVSTDAQDLTTQRELLAAAGCQRIFAEKITGTRADRPELARMIDHLRAGDVVTVTSLDRLARSTRDLLDIAERLQAIGAGLRSLSEPWADTTSPAGKMVLTVFAGIAEFERSLIVERTRRGREAARRRGVQFGRRPALTPAQVSHARELLAEGRAVPEVAALLNVHRATLYRVLARGEEVTKTEARRRGAFAEDALSEADALAAQSIEGQSFELDAGQKVELNEINGQQAKTLAKELNRDNENGDQVKAARAREIAERFKEKAARDREQARSFSR